MQDYYIPELIKWVNDFRVACVFVFVTFSMQNRCGPLLPISSPKPPTGTLKYLSQSLQLCKTYFWKWFITFEYIVLTQSIFVNREQLFLGVLNPDMVQRDF